MLQIWDLRKYQALHTYKMESPVMSMDISAKGLIGVATGRNMQVLRNAFTQPMDITYLQEEIRTPNAALAAGGGATAAAKALKSRVSISSVLFRPYEDLLCAGHSHGISTIIVPGAGEPNFDSFESNPFINPKQRREQEVQTLLTKLSHEMIGLGNHHILGRLRSSLTYLVVHVQMLHLLGRLKKIKRH